MRLVLDDEIDSLEREIAQVRNETYEPLKMKYKEALEECGVRKQIAKTRLITAETEIDIRFAAMVQSEWTQFNVTPSPLSFVIHFNV
jgi:hypothetical protein